MTKINLGVLGAVILHFFVVTTVLMMSFEVSGPLQVAGFLAGATMVIVAATRISMLISKKDLTDV